MSLQTIKAGQAVVLTGLALVAGVAVWRFGRGLSDGAGTVYNAAANGLQGALAVGGQAAAKIGQALAGSHDIQGSFAYVVFRADMFEDGKMKQSAYNAAHKMHPGNPAILLSTVTHTRELKQRYSEALKEHGLIAVTADLEIVTP